MPDDTKMRSSSSNAAQPPEASLRHPKMSPDMYERLCDIRDLPQFILLLYKDEADEVQYWFELQTNFPKDEVIPAVMAAMQAYLDNYAKNFKDVTSDQVDTWMGQLEALGEGQEPVQHPRAEQWRGAHKEPKPILQLPRPNTHTKGEE